MWTTLLAKLPWLKYWKAGLIALLTISLLLTTFYIKDIKRDLQDAKNALEIANANYYQCQTDVRKSKEVSNDYQKNLTALNAKLNKLRLQSGCILPDSGGGHNGTPAGTKLSGSNGISTSWLYEFAGRAEETRLKLIGCQRFVNEVCSQ